MADNHQHSEVALLPVEPVDQLIRPLVRFLHIEAASGAILAACAVGAFALANSPVGESYLAFWQMEIGLTVGEYHLEHSLKHWINDGLMAIFFFVIGLEVKREIVLGELRDLRRAALPIAGAIGGMLVPAGLYLALQAGQPGQRGWGIPMATDIAFVVGCMAVLGSRVPAALRVMLLSLAIVDDIGAILVIAIGYTASIAWGWLAMGAAGIALVVVLQRMGVRSMAMYTLVGIVIWVGFHESGIHATIAGVILGLLTPARPYLKPSYIRGLVDRASDMLHGGEWDQQSLSAARIRQYRQVTREMISPVEYLIYLLHPWIGFVIMPIFALANAGVAFDMADLLSRTSVAVMLGLVAGKPIGILLLCGILLKTGLVSLPTGVTWRHLAGGSFLAGIGFTMALFIASLAFRNDDLLQSAKVGVLAGSVISGAIGMTLLGTGATASAEPAPPDAGKLVPDEAV
jgi:Na+:H+ antiporter, NhaA family